MWLLRDHPGRGEGGNHPRDRAADRVPRSPAAVLRAHPAGAEAARGAAQRPTRRSGAGILRHRPAAGAGGRGRPAVRRLDDPDQQRDQPVGTAPAPARHPPEQARRPAVLARSAAPVRRRPPGRGVRGADPGRAAPGVLNRALCGPRYGGGRHCVTLKLRRTGRTPMPDDVSGPNRFARELFDPLPARYDRLAEILSFGQNGRWRSAMVEKILAREGRGPSDADGGGPSDPYGRAADALILDVASGTAGVALQLEKRAGLRVVGVDLTEEMLREGHRRVASAG